MTLLERDRENREEGYKEGVSYAAKILNMYNKGMKSCDIASSLQIDLEIVNSAISDYEKD